MACKVEKVKNKKLQELISTYGQKEGLLKFLGSAGDSYQSKGTTIIPEKTNYEKLIQQLSNRRINLLDTASKLKKEDNIKKQTLFERAKVLQDQIDTLEESQTVDTIKNIFDVHYKWINNILNEDKISLSDLTTARQFIGGWQGVKEAFISEELFDNTELEIVNKVNDIENKIQALNFKWNSKASHAVFNEVKDKSKRELTEKDYEKVVRVVKDIGGLEMYTYDASALDNTVLQIMDSVSKDSARSTTDSYNEIVNNLKTLYSNLEKKGIKDFNWLYQKDDKGNILPELSFVNRLSNKYFENVKKLKDLTDITYKKFKSNPTESNKNKYAQILKTKSNWYNENTISIDFRYMDFYGSYGNISEEDRNKYKERIEKHYGVEGANELFQHAERAYDTYLRAKQTYEDSQRSELDSDNISQEEYNKNIYFWDLENNPVYYLQQLEGNKSEASIQNVKNSGWKYITTSPRMWDKNGNRTQWYDKDYISIMSDPDKKAYYDYAKSTIRQMTEFLPSYATDELHTGFVPAVKSELNETFLRNGIGGFVKNLSEEFIDKYLVNDYQNDYTITDPKTGLPVKSVSINFISNNLSPENRSLDMNTIIQSYSMMALNYKNKTAIEDFINLSIEVLKSAKIDKDINQAPKNLITVAEFLRDSALYNEKYKKNEYIDKSKKRYKNKEEKLKAQEVSNEMQKLETLIENTTNENTKQKLLAEYRVKSKEYDKLGGFISYSKILEEGMYIQTLKAFAFNPFSAIANISFGVMSNITFASGGEYVTNNNLVSATKVMINSVRKLVGNNNPTATKIANLMDKFQIEAKTGDLDNISNSVKENFWKNLVHKHPFILMRSTDYFMRGQLFVGMMMNKKVEVNGKLISLWQAYDDNGNWKSEYGEEPDLSDFRNISLQIQKKVHGNFDKNASPILLNKSVLGRMIGQFRSSWVFEGFRARFQGEQFDEQLGTTTKGRYTSLKDYGGLKGILKFLFIDQFTNPFKDNFKDLSSVDRANMKRNLTELYIMEMMLLMALTLKGMYDDDDEKDWKYKMAKNLIHRTQDDVLFYINPTSFENIVKNPVPMFKVIVDTTDALHSTGKYIFDDDYDGEKLLRRYTNIVPGTNIYNKISTWSEREF